MAKQELHPCSGLDWFAGWCFGTFFIFCMVCRCFGCFAVQVFAFYVSRGTVAGPNMLQSNFIHEV